MLWVYSIRTRFIVFAMSAKYMDDAGRTPFMFLMIGYLLLTTGELFISPIGLSKVTELSPKSMTAFMMGVYFLSSSFAHYISKAIAKLTTSSESDEVPEPGFMTTMIENNRLCRRVFRLNPRRCTIITKLHFCIYTSRCSSNRNGTLSVYHYTNIKKMDAWRSLKIKQ